MCTFYYDINYFIRRFNKCFLNVINILLLMIIYVLTISNYKTVYCEEYQYNTTNCVS